MILHANRRLFATLVIVLSLAWASTQAHGPRPLSTVDVDDIATLLKLEDTRQFDGPTLECILKSSHPEVRRRAVVSIGRIAKEPGRALLVGLRTDADPTIVASVAFASGQLKDPGAVAWLGELLDNTATTPEIAREAAQALGKIRTPEARIALGRYLTNAPLTTPALVVGEALLSMGRFTKEELAPEDFAPIVRWATSKDEEIRWHVAWALFRPSDEAAVPHLLKLADDKSPEVRFWAVRGLPPALVDQAGLNRATVSARLLAATKDKDRRVRTEALRALLRYDDDGAFGALLAGLASKDTWISSSAAESAGRFQSRGAALTPALIAASGPSQPMWIRQLLLAPLTALAPEKAIEVATSLAREDSPIARTAAVQGLGRLGNAGLSRLEVLNGDPVLKGLLPAVGRGGRAGGGPALPPRPPTPPRTEADYRQLVEKWIVPDYNGEKRPRAIWTTRGGTIELELFPGDAPMGVEYFVQAVASGDIIGTEFMRVVPNFVAQQQTIRYAPVLRDEVSRLGLLRGNLSWATGGLDTGRPGYTLATAPHPHIEGDFTSLGRVVKGMDVVDHIEWGDKILTAKMR